MDKAEHHYIRDSARDSNDPEIIRRLYQTLIPEWLMPNVRLKLLHFLPKDISVVNTELEYMAYFHSLNDKMEVYTFVRRLFEEHNACAQVFRYRHMYIETSYLFCMDAAEGSMSSSFFMYIPKSYYRRYLEDVPLFYTTKVCIIVDYHRRLAYRFGLCISKMNEDIEAHSEDRSSLAESSIARSTTIRGGGFESHGRRAGSDSFHEAKCKAVREIVDENRKIHEKMRENLHQ